MTANQLIEATNLYDAIRRIELELANIDRCNDWWEVRHLIMEEETEKKIIEKIKSRYIKEKKKILAKLESEFEAL